jgi:hypothetical protein
MGLDSRHVLTIKFTGKDCEIIHAAARALQAAKKEKNKHFKAEESAKEIIARELKSKRQVDLDQLSDKEIVVVQCEGKDTVSVTRKPSDRFDQKSFALIHPNLVEEFTRPTPATYFDVLLA